MSRTNYPSRSIFGPLLLVGLGVVLLLINFNLLEASQLVHLARLWPLLLVGVGVNLLFARRAWVGNLVAVLLVGGAVAFLLAAPKLDLPASSAELRSEAFSEARGAAEAATLDMDIDRGILTIGALPASSANLVEIQASHNQRASFNASGEATKTIDFQLDADDFAGLFDLLNSIQNQNQTDVLLHPGLPLDLSIDLGSGSSTLNLEGLQITRLDLDNGSGTVNVVLPAGAFPVALSSGSGNMTVEIPSGSLLDFSANVGSGQISLALAAETSGQVRLDAGSGNIRLTLPEGVGVEITAETGSGNLTLPTGYVRVSGTERTGSGERGTWQSPGFAQAEFKLYLNIGVGSGNITLSP